MQGFCQELKRMVEMQDVQTVQLPDGSFIHRGRFKQKGKSFLIFKRVNEAEILVTSEGHYIPKEIIVGRSTPTRLFKIDAGQQFIKDGKRLEKRPVSGKVVILEKLIEEGKERNEKNKKLDAELNSGDRGPAGPGRRDPVL